MASVYWAQVTADGRKGGDESTPQPGLDATDRQGLMYVLGVAPTAKLTFDCLYSAIHTLSEDPAVEDEALWEVPEGLDLPPRLDRVYTSQPNRS